MPERFVNKAFFQRMSLRDKVWHFSSDPNTAAFAYDRLRRHLSAAEIQMRRINAAIKHVNETKPEEPDLADHEASREYFEIDGRMYESIFIEVHFYFVAWTNCQNMMKTLSSFPEYLEASKHYNSVRKHLDSYTEARNTFEHFHERLPAGKNRDRVKEIQAPNAGPRRVFGGLGKGSYTFSDRSWDITPASLNLLQSIVEEFLGKVHAVVVQRCDALLEQA